MNVYEEPPAPAKNNASLEESEEAGPSYMWHAEWKNKETRFIISCLDATKSVLHMYRWGIK